MEENQKEREYKEERFEYAVYVNDHIICKRNFKIFNFVEGSMETMEFKEKCDSVVKMIDDDLKSKSRVYLWRYFNPEFPDAEEELVSPLIEPWTYTFKFAVYDNKREVYARIWDGYGYPKFIRDRVDLSNKYVRVMSKDGQTYTYDKESFFKNNDSRLTFDQEVLKAMIMDKQDLLPKITKIICETCSASRDEMKGKRYLDASDSAKILATMTTSERFGDGSSSVVYGFTSKKLGDKLANQWGRLVSDKTKEYFKNLY